MECTTQQRASVAVSSQRTLANRSRSASLNVPRRALGSVGRQRARRRIESLAAPHQADQHLGHDGAADRPEPLAPPALRVAPRPGGSTTAACASGSRRRAAPHLLGARRRRRLDLRRRQRRLPQRPRHRLAGRHAQQVAAQQVAHRQARAVTRLGLARHRSCSWKSGSTSLVSKRRALLKAPPASTRFSHSMIQFSGSVSALLRPEPAAQGGEGEQQLERRRDRAGGRRC